MVGAYPPYPGSGWIGEAYLNIPDDNVENLLTVESYVRNHEPDFTFRTSWIDFPAGPIEANFDTEFDTIGDFLNDYIYDVSDPSLLDEPFDHFFLRFRGFLKVRLEDEIRDREDVGLPVWIDLGTMGYDGFRSSVVVTVYRIPDVNLNDNPWTNFGPACEVPGLYEVEVTYFNRYDVDGTNGSPLAGIELYGFWPSEKAWPAGQQMFRPGFGFGRLVPPDIIYQAEDVLPVEPGDFHADSDIDMADFQWLQICANPEYFFLPSGCDAFDVNGDARIEHDEVVQMLQRMADEQAGPGGGE